MEIFKGFVKRRHAVYLNMYSFQFNREGSFKQCSIFSEYSRGKMVIKYLHQTNPTNIGVFIVPDTSRRKSPKFLVYWEDTSNGMDYGDI